MLLVLAAHYVQAQNRVTNGGFERSNACPRSNFHYIEYLPAYTNFPTVVDWCSPMSTSSSAWLDSCGDVDRGVPSNAYVFQPGIYRCTAYNDSVYTIDSFSVLPKTYSSYTEVPACDLLGVPAVLQAGLSPAKYIWSTGDTGRVILPTVPALYTCLSSNACAIRRDSFLVKADSVRTYRHRPVCDTSGFNLVLAVKPSPYYSWNTGATTQQIQATRTGTYVCRSFDGCLFAIDSFNVTLVLPERPQVRDTNICQFIDSPQIQLRDTGLVWYASASSPRWTLIQPAITTAARSETTLYVAGRSGTALATGCP